MAASLLSLGFAVVVGLRLWEVEVPLVSQLRVFGHVVGSETVVQLEKVDQTRY